MEYLEDAESENRLELSEDGPCVCVCVGAADQGQEDGMSERIRRRTSSRQHSSSPLSFSRSDGVRFRSL